MFFDRHRMDVTGMKRGMIEQAFAQMREIPIAVAWGRDTLVHLDDMNAIPGHIFVGKRTQHQPRRMAAAESSGELPALGSGFPSFCCNDTSRLAGGSIGVSKDFDLHDGLPIGMGLS